MHDNKKYEGACLCGKVSFVVEPVENGFHACHCTMCQKQTGGPYMGVPLKGKPALSGDTMAWYSSSDHAERGFCNHCGSSLFWRMKEGPDALYIVSVGTLKDPTGLTLESHIFIDSKPSYYDFNDGKPCLTEEQVLAQYS